MDLCGWLARLAFVNLLKSTESTEVGSMVSFWKGRGRGLRAAPRYFSRAKYDLELYAYAAIGTLRSLLRDVSISRDD